MQASKVGKHGTVVIPAELRRRFGITEGDLVINEAHEEGVLIRPAVARPVDPERRRRLLEETNRDYAALRADEDAWGSDLAEQRRWDATLSDGLDSGEAWTDDGDVVRLTPTGNR